MKRDKMTPDNLLIDIQSWIVLSAGFSLLLLFIRIIATGRLTFAFLVWNLFLAFIPYLITERLVRDVRNIENKLRLLFSLVAWFVFIPNSFYIITDLFHLGQFGAAPKWFDLVLILSFAWNGILLGIISIQRVEMILTMLKGKLFSFGMLYVVIWFNAFGIYIGRYLRFNSWDVITDPFSLLRELLEMFFHPKANFDAWGMIFCYSFFITVIYFTIKKLGESLSQHSLRSTV
ncbi:MAG: DUF1361 domain-containing protein [Bacteroidetes bacterium]|nr:DUF1361 domain-containing protein [Bacteroidota bacterium]